MASSAHFLNFLGLATCTVRRSSAAASGSSLALTGGSGGGGGGGGGGAGASLAPGAPASAAASARADARSAPLSAAAVSETQRHFALRTVRSRALRGRLRVRRLCRGCLARPPVLRGRQVAEQRRRHSGLWDCTGRRTAKVPIEAESKHVLLQGSRAQSGASGRRAAPRRAAKKRGGGERRNVWNHGRVRRGDARPVAGEARRQARAEACVAPAGTSGASARGAASGAAARRGAHMRGVGRALRGVALPQLGAAAPESHVHAPHAASCSLTPDAALAGRRS